MFEQVENKETNYWHLQTFCSAEALDNQLTAVQQDRELRSQIEERKIRSDAAYEEAKRKVALQEEKQQQEKAKAEAEVPCPFILVWFCYLEKKLYMYCLQFSFLVIICSQLQSEVLGYFFFLQTCLESPKLQPIHLLLHSFGLFTLPATSLKLFFTDIYMSTTIWILLMLVEVYIFATNLLYRSLSPNDHSFTIFKCYGAGQT